MSTFVAGDKVVHLGGLCGGISRNRGVALTIKEGPLRISGYAGVRYIVDRPIYVAGRVNADIYHADEAYLMKLK